MGTRLAIFKWRQTEPGLILCAVRWYLRYSLRDVEELLEERGLERSKTTLCKVLLSRKTPLTSKTGRYLVLMSHSAPMVLSTLDVRLLQLAIGAQPCNVSRGSGTYPG